MYFIFIYFYKKPLEKVGDSQPIIKWGYAAFETPKMKRSEREVIEARANHEKESVKGKKEDWR